MFDHADVCNYEVRGLRGMVFHWTEPHCANARNNLDVHEVRRDTLVAGVGIRVDGRDDAWIGGARISDYALFLGVRSTSRDRVDNHDGAHSWPKSLAPVFPVGCSIMAMGVGWGHHFILDRHCFT